MFMLLLDVSEPRLKLCPYFHCQYAQVFAFFHEYPSTSLSPKYKANCELQFSDELVSRYHNSLLIPSISKVLAVRHALHCISDDLYQLCDISAIPKQVLHRFLRILAHNTPIRHLPAPSYEIVNSKYLPSQH